MTHPSRMGQSAALADALSRLLERLVEHLAVEEDHAVPLIERHITTAEWSARDPAR